MSARMLRPSKTTRPWGDSKDIISKFGIECFCNHSSMYILHTSTNVRPSKTTRPQGDSKDISKFGIECFAFTHPCTFYIRVLDIHDKEIDWLTPQVSH